MNLTYRVRRPEEFKELLDTLSIKSNSEFGVFDDYKSILVFAASVGYKLKQRVIIPDETLETFGNNIPALLKLQGVLELISPEVLYKYLSLETKFEFESVSK